MIDDVEHLFMCFLLFLDIYISFLVKLLFISLGTGPKHLLKINKISGDSSA